MFTREDASLDVPSTTVSAPGPAAGPAMAEDVLVLGNPNKTLSSFAQLAASQLDADRALIRSLVSFPHTGFY